MPNIIKLSETDIKSAQATFKHWLDDEPFTLLLIPGKHAKALEALKKADQQVNSGSQNYASVRVVHAPVATFIVPLLKGLKNATPNNIDLAHIHVYAILVITNKYSNIAGFATNLDFTGTTGGIINQMVADAFALDKML